MIKIDMIHDIVFTIEWWGVGFKLQIFFDGQIATIPEVVSLIKAYDIAAKAIKMFMETGHWGYPENLDSFATLNIAMTELTAVVESKLKLSQKVNVEVKRK